MQHPLITFPGTNQRSIYGRTVGELRALKTAVLGELGERPQDTLFDDEALRRMKEADLRALHAKIASMFVGDDADDCACDDADDCACDEDGAPLEVSVYVSATDALEEIVSGAQPLATSVQFDAIKFAITEFGVIARGWIAG